MTISSRLKFNVLMSIVLVLVMSAAFGAALLVERRARERDVFGDRLLEGITELNEVTEYYLRHPEKRPQAQWKIGHDTLAALLGRGPGENDGTLPIDRMTRNLADMDVLFRELVAIDDGARGASALPPGDRALSRGKREQLADLIAVRSSELTDAAAGIASEGTAGLEAVDRKIVVFFPAFAILILALTIWSSLGVSRSIADPLERLRHGTEIVGSGDLDYRVGTAAHDEIGDLSRSFDAMTERLKAVTVSKEELLREVEERNRAEGALQKINERFRVAIAGSPISVHQHDRDLIFTWIYNPPRGFTQEDFIGKKIEDVYEPEDAARIRGIKEQVLATGVGTRGVTRFTLKGEQFFVDYSIEPIRDGSGEVTGLTCALVDITTRTLAEEALRESEERLNRAQAIAHLGSWELDPASNRLSWSDEIYRILGCDPGGFEATWETFLERVHPDDRAAVEAAYAGSIREGRDAYEIDHRVVRKDSGAIRVVHQKCEHHRDAEGRVVRSLGMVHDITERKMAEETLLLTTRHAEEMARELARSNRDLEQFAYVASHDLQEPLRAVTGFLGLLKTQCGGTLDKTSDEYIAVAVDGAKRMAELIQDLLAYSRVSTAASRPKAASCEEALERAAANLRLGISDSGAIISHDELPTVMADPTQLTQLLQNLIGNAIKFHRPGVAPEVHLGGRHDGAQWVLWVRDNGIGIPADQDDRIFKVFQRLHTRAKYPGTGIGLAICKKIVERHGGKIWVEPQIGEGTTFYFTLPAADGGAAAGLLEAL